MNTRYPKNTIVIYKGGGYDGCVWEWNAFCWDANREFVQLGASGSDGIHDPKDGYRKYLEIKNNTDSRHLLGDALRLTCKKDMRFLAIEYVTPLVLSVTKQVRRHYRDELSKHPDTARIQLVALCSECGCEIFPEDEDCERAYYSVDVVSSSGRCSGPFYYSGLICPDCYDEGCCRACLANEPYDEDEPYWGKDELTSEGYCECHVGLALLEPLHDGLIWKTPETEELLSEFQKIPWHNQDPDRIPGFSQTLLDQLNQVYQEQGMDVVHAYPRNHAPGQKMLPGMQGQL